MLIALKPPPATLLMLALLLASCASPAPAPQPSSPTAAHATPTVLRPTELPTVQPPDLPATVVRTPEPLGIRAGLAFTLNLFKQVSAEQHTSNVVLSPLSAGLALAIVANGARDDTLRAMLGVLSGDTATTLDQLNAHYAALQSLLSRRGEEGLALRFANSIWMRQDWRFSERFQTRIQQHYDAELRRLDFADPAAPNAINRWASEETEGRVPAILDRIPLEAVMYVLNAIYFKGSWATPFDQAATAQQPFFLADGSQKQVPLMYQRGKMRYLQGEDFQAVQLPYSGSLHTTVILPSVNTPLAQWLSTLSVDRWEEWQSQFAKREGELYLPRFTLKGDYRLAAALAALGMGVAFSNRANFYDMLASDQMPPIRISEVRQRTLLEVNELGAEAAAVTAVEMVETALLPSAGEPFVMRVDRPFLLTVEDSQTGLPLFISAIFNPAP
ncbi:MAG: serpin family protein [Thermoflexales bacterium]